MASPESKAVRQLLLDHKAAQSGKPFSVEETRIKVQTVISREAG